MGERLGILAAQRSAPATGLPTAFTDNVAQLVQSSRRHSMARENCKELLDLLSGAQNGPSKTRVHYSFKAGLRSIISNLINWSLSTFPFFFFFFFLSLYSIEKAVEG